MIQFILNKFYNSNDLLDKAIKIAAKYSKDIVLPCNPIPFCNPMPNPKQFSVWEKIIKLNRDKYFDKNKFTKLLSSMNCQYNLLFYRINNKNLFTNVKIFPPCGNEIDYSYLQVKLSDPCKYFFQVAPGFGATGLASSGDYNIFYGAIALHTLIREEIQDFDKNIFLGRMIYLSSFCNYKTLV